MPWSPRLLPVLLGFLSAAALPAQYTGEGPTPLGSLAVEAPFLPSRFGLHSIESISCLPTGMPGVLYVAVTGRSTALSALAVSDWLYDMNTNQLHPLLDFQGVAQAGDAHVSVAPDLRTAVLYNSGVVSICQRPGTSGPWGQRRPVTNLPPGLHAPFLASSIAIGHVLAGCTPPPNSRAWMFDLDATTATAHNGRSFGPALGGPGNYFQAVALLYDHAFMTWLGILLIERQFLSSQQRLYYTASQSGDGAYHAVLDAPLQNVLTSICLLNAATMLMACQGPLPISQYPNSVLRLDLSLMGDRSISSSGGLVEFALACRELGPVPAKVGFMAIALLNSAPLTVAGIGGRLGLNPGSMLVLGPQPNTSTGIMRWPLQVPPLQPGLEFFIQGLVLASATGLADFSNTASFHILR